MANIRALRTFFYLREAEYPPKDAPDAWFEGTDYSVIRSDADVENFAYHSYAILDEISNLTNEDEIQAVFYARAKLALGEDKAQIRQFFKMLYYVLFGLDHGPRWGQFVLIMGVENFSDRLRAKLDNPF